MTESQVHQQDERLEIAIPTRGREGNLLMLLQALRSQTAQNWDLIIVDDNDDPSLLRKSHNFNVMLNLLQMEGHRWRVIKGLQKGPHFVHNILLMSASHEFVLRLDDDILPSKDFVERLYLHIPEEGPKVAAVGGVFPDPRNPTLEDCYLTKPEEIARADENRLQAVKQRYLHEAPVVESVPVLYSSFIYRQSALLEVKGLPTVYSPIGESEETDTTFRLYYMGYTLLVDQAAVAWHFLRLLGASTTAPNRSAKHGSNTMWRSGGNAFVNWSTGPLISKPRENGISTPCKTWKRYVPMPIAASSTIPKPQQTRGPTPV